MACAALQVMSEMFIKDHFAAAAEDSGAANKCIAAEVVEAGSSTYLHLRPCLPPSCLGTNGLSDVLLFQRHYSALVPQGAGECES